MNLCYCIDERVGLVAAGKMVVKASRIKIWKSLCIMNRDSTINWLFTIERVIHISESAT
jgi:hypothetical protein